MGSEIDFHRGYEWPCEACNFKRRYEQFHKDEVWTIKPIIEGDTLIRLEVAKGHVDEMGFGDPVFRSKREADNNLGVFWNPRWDRYKNSENVKNSDPTVVHIPKEQYEDMQRRINVLEKNNDEEAMR